MKNYIAYYAEEGELDYFDTHEEAESWLRDWYEDGFPEETIKGRDFIAKITHNFLSGTMFLSDEQTGKYIRLLCTQHLTGHLSENDMIFICKQYDENIFKKFIEEC